MTTSMQAGRSVGLTLVVGAGCGAMIGFLSVTMDPWGMEAMGGFASLALAGAVFGAVIGAVVGLFLGLPVIVVAGLLWPRTRRWRSAGALCAAIVSVPATAWLLMGSPLVSLVVQTAVAAGVAAGGSWWSLGRIFPPSPACAGGLSRRRTRHAETR